jgi:two-component system nitrate/nitrite response regulator NarL
VLLDLDVDGVRCLVLDAPAPRRSNLSPREKEIASMVAEGYPNKTIAAKLNISSWTVSTYLRRIFGKLDVHSRTAMVARVFEEDLLSDAAEARAGSPAHGDDHARESVRGRHAPRVSPRRGSSRILPARAGRRGADGV